MCPYLDENIQCHPFGTMIVGISAFLKFWQKRETLWWLPKEGREYRRRKLLMGEFCSAKACIYSIHLINAMF
jgi:hypothetical protein